ncbi:hypothetical protein CLOM_g9728, partial [Closterium sp. NIES-68]
LTLPTAAARAREKGGGGEGGRENQQQQQTVSRIKQKAAENNQRAELRNAAVLRSLSATCAEQCCAQQWARLLPALLPAVRYGRFPPALKGFRGVATHCLLVAVSVAAAKAVDARPRERELDLCAVTGGKSLCMAQSMARMRARDGGGREGGRRG